MANYYNALSDVPAHIADLCPAISKYLVDILVDRLPPAPALTLSIGCGSGLLEAILLYAGENERGKPLNITGVEVPDCVVKHLPEGRILIVPTTSSIHSDAMLVSALVFVYPRKPDLIAMYLDASLDGALERLVWLGHRSDWPETQMLLLAAFFKLERIDGPGIVESELLVIASMPRRTRKQCD
jgi:hypothetical protein